MSWLIYFAKVSFIQILAYFAYSQLLEKEAIGQWKRVYLIGSLLLSFILPLLVIKTVFVPFSYTDADFDLYAFTNIATSVVQSNTNYIQLLTSLLIVMLLAVSCYRLVPIIRYLKRHSRRLSHAKKSKRAGYQLAILPYDIEPHTFGKTIFISQQSQLHPAVLTHEIAHACQWHSADRMLLAVIRAICWFMPQIQLYETALILVHEQLADKAVLQSGVSVESYQNLLLSTFSVQFSQIGLASGFDFSITKKRFHMMRLTYSSPTTLAAKSLIIALLWFGLGFSTTNTVYAQQPPPPPPPIPTSMLVYHQDGSSTIKANPPSKEQLTNWINKKEYSIWIDGKAIEKASLLKHTTEDFPFFMVNKLDRDPANFNKYNYQVTLLTKAGFEKFKKIAPRQSPPPPPPHPNH